MPKASLLKSRITPKEYYETVLGASLIKPSAKGWGLLNCKCPFHPDKKAGSFAINTKTGAFKCFSCGERGGDIIDFHQKYYNQTFKEALADLSGRVL